MAAKNQNTFLLRAGREAACGLATSEEAGEGGVEAEAGTVLTDCPRDSETRFDFRGIGTWCAPLLSKRDRLRAGGYLDRIIRASASVCVNLAGEFAMSFSAMELMICC